MRTVCIVEPDDEVRACAEEAFKKVNFNVVCFKSQREASTAFKSGVAFDVFVTNVGKAAEGYDFVQEFRKIPGHEYTPVYLFTSHTPASFKEATGINVDNLGAHAAYIQKNGELMEELARIVQGRAAKVTRKETV